MNMQGVVLRVLHVPLSASVSIRSRFAVPRYCLVCVIQRTFCISQRSIESVASVNTNPLSKIPAYFVSVIHCIHVISFTDWQSVNNLRSSA